MGMKITLEQFETMQSEIKNAKETRKQFTSLTTAKSMLQRLLSKCEESNKCLQAELKAVRHLVKRLDDNASSVDRAKERAAKDREHAETSAGFVFAEMKINEEIRSILGAGKDDGPTKEFAEQIMAELEQMRSENDQLKTMAQATAVTL